MKRQILLLMTICTLTAYSQDTLKSKLPKGFKKILIGFNISPDYCNRTLKNNDGAGTSGLIIDMRNQRETGRPGFTAGFNICVNFSKNTGFETGIQYSLKGYQTAKYGLVYPVPDPTAPVRAKFLYTYHTVDIPLKINITKGNGKLRFIGAAGITTNILIMVMETSILEYAYNNRRSEETYQSPYNYRKINLSPAISLGMDYRINNNMYLRAEPTFRYGLLKNINTPVTEHLWSAGLNMGFYYGLK
jgi:Outer membrane protein beta-barrel domain